MGDAINMKMFIVEAIGTFFCGREWKTSNV